MSLEGGSGGLVGVKNRIWEIFATLEGGSGGLVAQTRFRRSIEFLIKISRWTRWEGSRRPEVM